jgi:hypothetical protein
MLNEKLLSFSIQACSNSSKHPRMAPLLIGQFLQFLEIQSDC